jgi:hypothetical protein
MGLDLSRLGSGQHLKVDVPMRGLIRDGQVCVRVRIVPNSRLDILL